MFNLLLHTLDDRIRIAPVTLNESEFQFVQDLKAWLAANASDDSGEAFYLLRNRVFRGVGFFEAGGFWPDFILWHINAEGEQTIVFVDPHGVRLGDGPASPKIQLGGQIKDIERRINAGPSAPVRLESAIVTPSNAAQVRANWGVTNQDLDDSHVFFMDDVPGYLDRLVTLARAGAAVLNSR